MYKIIEVTDNIKEIKKLHKFFWSLDSSFVPNLKRYIFFIKLGKAYAIMNGKDVVGGLVMYSIKEQNVVLNYYVPEEKRHGLTSKDMFALLLKYVEERPAKPTLLTSKDVSTYHRFVKHLKDDVYQLMIPDSKAY